MSKKLKEITRKVLSYCDIPEEIAKSCASLEETACDTFIEYEVTSKERQKDFDDDFTLDNWIIKNWPELEGVTILIEIDY